VKAFSLIAATFGLYILAKGRFADYAALLKKNAGNDDNKGAATIAKPPVYMGG